MSSHQDVPRYPKPEAVLRAPDYGHAVIEASAGTGKTYTIEHLVVDHVVRGATLDEILVVTFTERAAAELKRRIRARLRELVLLETSATDSSIDNCWVVDQAVRARLSTALVDFDAAAISTIHGFCRSVLVDNAFLSGSLLQERHVDARAAFSRAFKHVLRSELSQREELLPYLLAWLGVRRASVDALEELLFEAARTRAPVRPSFDAERLRSALSGYERVTMSAAELIGAGVGRGSVRKVYRNLERMNEAHAHYRKTGDIAALVAELDAVELSYLAGKLRAFEELAGTASSLSAAVVTKFLPVVLERLAQTKLEEGLVDFDDMLRRVATTLEGPRGAELAQRLQARYRYVLVDEFQDTDDIQWSIFRKLFFASGAKTPLSLVGDPKQAIYGFRGADVHVYLRARSELVTRSAMVPLVESFRSTSELIDALNLVFDQKAESPFFTGNVRYDRPLRSGRPELRLVGVDGETASPVVLLRSEDKKPLPRYIAREIARLLKDEAGQLRFGDEGSETPIAPEDIFVLTRTTREALEVGEALAERGVPFAFYKREGLFQSREAEDVLSLLSALVDLRDRTKRLRAWMTPFFGLSLRELERCGSLPSEHPMMRRLIEWKSLADAREYERLFGRIFDESGILARELFSGRDARARVNYVHIVDVLLEEAHENDPSLPELVQTLESYVDGSGLSPESDRNVMRLTSDRAVQVLTIHMAKGLETTVVFLYAFSKMRSGGIYTYYDHDEKNAYVGKLDEAPSDVREAIDRERREEDQRLFYVALTRAKARLYLPVLPEDARGLGCYEQVNRCLNGLVDAFETEEVRAAEPAPPSRATTLDPWTPPPELLAPHDNAPLFDELRRRHRGLVVTSYSRLKSLRGGYRPPIEQPPADADESLLPGGSAVGVFLHDVLEQVNFETLRPPPPLEAWRARDDVARIFREAMRRNGIESRFRAEAEQLVYAALTSPIALGREKLEGGFASLETELREVEFVYPYPETDGKFRRGFAKGFVDFVFELSGRTYFCDWKSDVLGSFALETLNDHVRRNYVLQAKLYTLALVKMLGVDAEPEYEARFGGIVYCFLRGLPDEGVYYARPSWSTVATWRDELAREERL